MNKIIITADSGVNPVDEDLMISGTINSSNRHSYKDVKEIEPYDIIYRKENGEVFRTSSPITGDYLDLFEKELNNGNDIIHISMSSGISEGSVNGAILASNMLNSEYQNKVYVVDSHTSAAGGTILCEYAKELAKSGLSTQEVVDELNKQKSKIVSSYFVPDASGFIFSGRNKTELGMKEKLKLLSTTAMKRLKMNCRVDFNKDGNLYFRSIYRGKAGTEVLKYTQDIINANNVTDFNPSDFTLLTMPLNNINKDDVLNYVKDLKYFDNIIDKKFNGVYTSYGCRDLISIGLMKKIK